MNGRRTGCLKVWLTLLLLILATGAEAATVSGTVTNNTSSAGRVFLVGKWSGGGNAGWGKSVTVGANSSTGYTIRGLQDGSYVVDAFLDTQNSGSPHAKDPSGTSAPFGVSGGANVTNVNVSLSNPTPVPLQPPTGAQVVSGDGGVLVMWEPAQDFNTGRQIATSHQVYWSTSPNPGPLNMTGGGTSGDIRNAGDVNGYCRSFTNGTQFYFAVTAKLDGSESAPTNANGGAPVVVGPPVGGVTVSGTVTTTGASLSAATPLYLVLPGETGPPKYVARVAAPSASQTFTIAGVQPGNYGVYAILDMDNNGFVNLGDITNTNSDGVPITVGGSPVSNTNVTLNGSANATVTVQTEHGKQNASEWYGLYLEVGANRKRPVNAAVSGPNLGAGPIDLANSKWGPLEGWPGLTARPTLAPSPDSYSFAIEYSDETTTGASPISAPVTGVVDSFATPVAPVGLVSSPFSGQFSWSAPASPPTPYTYSFLLDVPGFSDDGYYHMPSNTTNVSYPYPYVDGDNYFWSISVADGLGNYARQRVSFSPTLIVDQTAPVVTANPAGGLFSGSINVYLTANEPATIYYTTNGATPTTSSPSFLDSVGNVPKGPIAISAATTLKYFAKDIAGNSSAIQTQTYTPSQVKVGAKEFLTIQSAYSDTATGTTTELSSLKVKAGTLTETITCDRNIQVTLDGGYDAAYGSPTGTTKVKGKMLVRAGAVRTKKMVVF